VCTISKSPSTCTWEGEVEERVGGGVAGGLSDGPVVPKLVEAALQRVVVHVRQRWGVVPGLHLLVQQAQRRLGFIWL
jgi:hypothetical protein